MNVPITKQDIADIVGAKVDQRFDELKSMIENQTIEIAVVRDYVKEGFGALIHHNEIMDEQIQQLSLKMEGLAKRNDYLAEIKADRTELGERKEGNTIELIPHKRAA